MAKWNRLSGGLRLLAVDGMLCKTRKFANTDSAFGGNRDSLPIYILHMVEHPSKAREEFILISPGIDAITTKIKVEFRDPAKGQRIEKEDEFPMRRDENSFFFPGQLY